MTDAIMILGAAFAIYPLGVLVIALTGPHSELERNDLNRRRRP